jgi:predicted Rdx family selenoprotein
VPPFKAFARIAQDQIAGASHEMEFVANIVPGTGGDAEAVCREIAIERQKQSLAAID